MTTQEVEELRHATQGTLDLFGSVLTDLRHRILTLSLAATEAIERAERAEADKASLIVVFDRRIDEAQRVVAETELRAMRAERIAEEAKAEANRLATEVAHGR